MGMRLDRGVAIDARNAIKFASSLAKMLRALQAHRREVARRGLKNNLAVWDLGKWCNSIAAKPCFA